MGLRFLDLFAGWLRISHPPLYLLDPVLATSVKRKYVSYSQNSLKGVIKGIA